MVIKDPHQRTKLFAGIFFITIMVLSTMGLVLDFQNNTPSYTYDGFEFAQRKNAWELQLNDRALLFGLHPSQLESIPVNTNLSTVFTGLQQVYITYDAKSEGKAALAEVAFDFEQRLSAYANVFAVPSLMDPNGTASLGITCMNATSSVPVVAFVIGNETSIFVNNTCITATSNGEWDFLGLEERMLYTVLGVMS